MSPSISDFYNAFPGRTLLAKQSAECVSSSQDPFYFQLASLKSARTQSLVQHFSRAKVRRLFVGANISGFAFDEVSCPVEFLEKGFFHETDPEARERKCAHLQDSVVILNNNDVGHNEGTRSYAEFFSRCPGTVFVAWDWDNHHWLELSTFLAVHSDLYAPAHHENLYPLTRFNWLTAGPVYCGSVQWSKPFLAEHLPELLETERVNDPLGMHIPYAPFRFRNQVLATLNQHYPTIGFSDRSFHERTPADRLREWCSHKSHWIVPVLNDVPIRIFDALITGGIPIVPDSLRFLPPVHDIDRKHILFYAPQDVLAPQAIVAKAREMFDEGGHEGILERHRFALKYHHGAARMEQMLKAVREVYKVEL